MMDGEQKLDGEVSPGAGGVTSVVDRKALLSEQSDELILRPNSSRWVLFPIEYHSLFKYYKWLQAQYWNPAPLIWQPTQMLAYMETRHSRDLLPWARVELGVVLGSLLMQGFPSHPFVDTNNFPDILDLVCEFTQLIQSPEGRAFLGFQNLLEDFHRQAFLAAAKAMVKIPAVLEEEPPTPTSADASPPFDLDRSLALFSVHLLAKQRWFLSHLGGFANFAKIKRLAGDSAVLRTTPTAEDEAPVAEVLVALGINHILQRSAVLLLHHRGSDRAQNEEDALYQVYRHHAVDCALFGDFALHIYANLTHQLKNSEIHLLLMQAAVLEFQHLQTLFGPVIHTEVEAAPSSRTSTSKSSTAPLTVGYLGSFVRYLCTRVLQAVGHDKEGMSQFQHLFDTQGERVAAEVHEVYWPIIRAESDAAPSKIHSSVAQHQHIYISPSQATPHEGHQIFDAGVNAVPFERVPGNFQDAANFVDLIPPKDARNEPFFSPCNVAAGDPSTAPTSNQAVMLDEDF